MCICLAVSAFCWYHNICSPWFLKALEYPFPFHLHVSASACLFSVWLYVHPCFVFCFFFILPLSTTPLLYFSVASICNDIPLVQKNLIYLMNFHISLVSSPPPLHFFPYTFFYFCHFPPQLICYLLIIPSSSLPPLFILPSSLNAISRPLITLSNSSSPSYSLRFLADRWLIFGPAMLESLMLFLWYPTVIKHLQVSPRTEKKFCYLGYPLMSKVQKQLPSSWERWWQKIWAGLTWVTTWADLVGRGHAFGSLLHSAPFSLAPRIYIWIPQSRIVLTGSYCNIQVKKLKQ